MRLSIMGLKTAVFDCQFKELNQDFAQICFEEAIFPTLLDNGREDAENLI